LNQPPSRNLHYVLHLRLLITAYVFMHQQSSTGLYSLTPGVSSVTVWVAYPTCTTLITSHSSTVYRKWGSFMLHCHSLLSPYFPNILSLLIITADTVIRRYFLVYFLAVCVVVLSSCLVFYWFMSCCYGKFFLFFLLMYIPCLELIGGVVSDSLGCLSRMHHVNYFPKYHSCCVLLLCEAVIGHINWRAALLQGSRPYSLLLCASSEILH